MVMKEGALLCAVQGQLALAVTLTLPAPPLAVKFCAVGLMVKVVAVTLTVKLAVAVAPPPSVTCKPTMFAPTVAAQEAATSAVMVPLVLTRLVTLMPAGADVTVTIRLPAGVSASLTVAMVEVVAALLCWRDRVGAAVIVGGVLTGACTSNAPISLPSPPFGLGEGGVPTGRVKPR